MAAWTDAFREIRPLVEVQWDGTTWTDETQYFVNATGVNATLELPDYAHGREFPYWTADLIMKEGNERFNPYYTSGALYTHIQESEGLGYLTPIRISVELKDGMSYLKERLFTGYIEKIDGTDYVRNECRFQCVDNHLPFAQHVKSTTITLNSTTSQWLTILKNFAGVTSTDYDIGLFTHPFLFLDDERISHEMSLAAQSELGCLYFDRNGTHTFRNFESWLSGTRQTTVQHAFTTSNYQNKQAPTDWRNVYSDVVVMYGQRQLGAVSNIYSLERPFVISRNSSRKVICRHNPYALSPVTPSGQDLVAATSGGLDISSDISVVATKFAGKTELTITNANTQHAAYVTRLNITGAALLGGESEEESVENTVSFLPSPKTLRFADQSGTVNNLYIDSRAQALFIANAMADHTNAHRRKYIVKGPGIPDLEPRDLVTIQDDQIGTRQGFIMRTVWDLNGRSFKQTHTILDSSNWLPFADADLHEIDVSTFAQAKKAFY